MRCSKCFEEVKPVVAIDIDGTLGDYHGHFIRFAADFLGFDPRKSGAPPYAGDAPFKVWFSHVFDVDYTTFRAVKLAYRQGGLKRTMPVELGASQMLDDFRRVGAEVWLTTTRPHDRYDRVDPDTREWTRRNAIPFHGLLFSGDKMSALYDIVEAERVVAVLDDQEDVLSEASARFGCKAPILKRNDYNKAITWHTSVQDLGRAASLITTRIAEWKGRHQ